MFGLLLLLFVIPEQRDHILVAVLQLCIQAGP